MFAVATCAALVFSSSAVALPLSAPLCDFELTNSGGPETSVTCFMEEGEPQPDLSLIQVSAARMRVATALEAAPMSLNSLLSKPPARSKPHSNMDKKEAHAKDPPVAPDQIVASGHHPPVPSTVSLTVSGYSHVSGTKHARKSKPANVTSHDSKDVIKLLKDRLKSVERENAELQKDSDHQVAMARMEEEVEELKNANVRLHADLDMATTLLNQTQQAAHTSGEAESDAMEPDLESETESDVAEPDAAEADLNAETESDAAHTSEEAEPFAAEPDLKFLNADTESDATDTSEELVPDAAEPKLNADTESDATDTREESEPDAAESNFNADTASDAAAPAPNASVHDTRAVFEREEAESDTAEPDLSASLHDTKLVSSGSEAADGTEASVWKISVAADDVEPTVLLGGRNYSGNGAETDDEESLVDVSLAEGSGFSVAFTASWHQFNPFSRVLSLSDGTKDVLRVMSIDDVGTLSFSVRRCHDDGHHCQHDATLDVKQAITANATSRYLCSVSPEGKMQVYKDGRIVGRLKPDGTYAIPGQPGGLKVPAAEAKLYVARRTWMQRGKDVPPFEGFVGDICLWGREVQPATSASCIAGAS